MVYDGHNDDDDQNNDDNNDDNDVDDLSQDSNDRSFSSVDTRQNKSKTCEDHHNHVGFLKYFDAKKKLLELFHKSTSVSLQVKAAHKSV